MRKLPAVLSAAIVAAGLSIGPSAQAALILQGPQNFQGSGLGAVNTILTIQSPGNSTTETGSVSFNGTTDVRTGDTQNGASQTLTRTIGELGLTNAASLRVVFNALEPGNAADNSIQLNNLVLTIYSTTGATLFSSGAFAPILFPDTFTGAGNSGFVFALDATQAAAAQAAGFETFFVANSPTTTPVPEPASLALLGAGLLGLGLARRRKRT